MAALQSTDYVALRALSDQGNRVGYWSYLADKGDPYANLALGVATNETVAGYIANNFFLSQARSAGLSLTETQLYQVGVDLMRADLAARELRFNQGAPDGGLTVGALAVYRYHDAVFKGDTNNQLDGRAWTGELALRDALSHGAETGDYSRAEAIWSNMQSSSFWTQVSSMDSVPSGLEGAAWKLSVAGSVASFQATALIGNPMAEFSLRNTGQVEGWSQSGDGQWYRYVPGSNVDIMGNSTGFSPDKIYAESLTSDHLNQAQQVRQQRYGASAVHIADGSNSHAAATEGSFAYDPRGYLIEADALRSDGGSVKSVFESGSEAWSSEISAFDAYQRLQSIRVDFDGGGHCCNPDAAARNFAALSVRVGVAAENSAGGAQFQVARVGKLCKAAVAKFRKASTRDRPGPGMDKRLTGAGTNGEILQHLERCCQTRRPSFFWQELAE